MTLRAIKGRCFAKGFRVRQIALVTTLLDPQLCLAPEILQAYLRRWRLEMCLGDLKTTLKLDFLRARSPQMAQKGTAHAFDCTQLNPLHRRSSRRRTCRGTGTDQLQR